MKVIRYNDRITIKVFPDKLKLDIELASLMAKKINKGLCILPGGTTPKNLYCLLSKNFRIKKNRKIILSDDRLVDDNNEQSNYNMISKNLDINLDSNYRISYYELLKGLGLSKTLHYISNKMLNQPIECSLLGIGEDSHTASLFPNNKKAFENDDLGLIVENKDFMRFSLGFNTLLSSKKIIFMVAGKNKKSALKFIFGKNKNHLIYPVQKLFDEHSNIELFCDKDSEIQFLTK